MYAHIGTYIYNFYLKQVANIGNKIAGENLTFFIHITITITIYILQ